MGWFRDWFGTSYYDLLYAERDEEEACSFINVLIDHLGLTVGSRVLDIGCGNGRHSHQLAQRGMWTVGLDIITENIRQATLISPPNARFIRHDMREPFPVAGFDCALNLFTSFGYFDTPQQEQRTLHNINNALVKGGMLVIDFLNAEKVKTGLVSEEQLTREGIRFIIQRRITDGYVVKDIEVQDGDQRHGFQEKVHLLTQSDFERMLNSTGFRLKSVYGSYGLKEFNRESSDRLILIAEKA